MSKVLKEGYDYIRIDPKTNNGYKYKTLRRVSIQTNIATGGTLQRTTPGSLVTLMPGGLLIVAPGYRWDGASGIAIDTDGNMRAALFHDVLYFMLRNKTLPMSFKWAADRVLRDVMREDMIAGGAWKIWAVIRSWYFWAAVKYVGRRFAGLPKGGL